MFIVEQPTPGHIRCKCKRCGAKLDINKSDIKSFNGGIAGRLTGFEFAAQRTAWASIRSTCSILCPRRRSRTSMIVVGRPPEGHIRLQCGGCDLTLDVCAGDLKTFVHRESGAQQYGISCPSCLTKHALPDELLFTLLQPPKEPR